MATVSITDNKVRETRTLAVDRVVRFAVPSSYSSSSSLWSYSRSSNLMGMAGVLSSGEMYTTLPYPFVRER
jgi:hypothetical protein